MADIFLKTAFFNDYYPKSEYIRLGFVKDTICTHKKGKIDT